MSRDALLNREKLCFDVLNSLGSANYVLVGGYAVSSFDFPRLSVDLDLVIQESEINTIKHILESRGFSKTEELSGFDQVYSGKFERYKISSQLPVAVDLLINAIKSRQTNFSYSFDYLMKNSEVREVRGWAQGLKSLNRIVDKELLLALKINSMRISDKRDVIALCYSLPNTEKVFNHIKNCNKEIILANLNSLLEMLTNEKYKDSIKGVFSIPDKILERTINNCKNVLESLFVLLNKI